jgi:hypothetical protein
LVGIYSSEKQILDYVKTQMNRLFPDKSVSTNNINDKKMDGITLKQILLNQHCTLL